MVMSLVAESLYFVPLRQPKRKIGNTSLAAQGALAHCLQHQVTRIKSNQIYILISNTRILLQTRLGYKRSPCITSIQC